MRWLVVSALSLGALAWSGASASSDTPHPRVQIEMRNVRLHVAGGIAMDVAQLRGTMISRSEAPPVFDNQRSYVIEVDTASLSMSLESVQALMNNHLFAAKEAPLKNIKVAADGTQLKMSGKLHKGVDLPFSTKASVKASADGRLQFHTESMKALGIPAKGMLDLFGLKLDDLVNLKNQRGIAIEGDDILIAPGQALPPPEMRGRVVKVALDRGRLVQVFDDGGAKPKRLTPPSASAKNYIYFSGGDITFGKLTMHGADLQLIDNDPADPFDFYPEKYNAQLVAGYSKNTPSGGLKTYMPDYDDLRRGAKNR